MSRYERCAYDATAIVQIVDGLMIVRDDARRIRWGRTPGGFRLADPWPDPEEAGYVRQWLSGGNRVLVIVGPRHAADAWPEELDSPCAGKYLTGAAGQGMCEVGVEPLSWVRDCLPGGTGDSSAAGTGTAPGGTAGNGPGGAADAQGDWIRLGNLTIWRRANTRSLCPHELYEARRRSLSGVAS